MAETLVYLLESDRWTYLLAKVDGSDEVTPSYTLMRIVSADPTAKPDGSGPDGTSPTPGKYSEWLVRKFLEMPAQERRRFVSEDYEKVREDLAAYHRGKAKLDVSLRDINSFRGTGSAAMIELFKVAEGLRGEGADMTSTQRAASEVATLFNDGEWLVAVPLTHGGMRSLGGGTRWCNYAGEGMFDRYFEEGHSFVLVKGNGYGGREKFQWHPPSGQCMDSDDDPVDLTELLARLPQGAREAMVGYVRKTGAGYDEEGRFDCLLELGYEDALVEAAATVDPDSPVKVKQLTIRAGLVRPQDVTNSDAQSPVSYTRTGDAVILLGGNDEDLEDLVREICDWPEGMMNLITMEDDGDDRHCDWKDVVENVSDENLKRIRELAAEAIEESGIGEEVDPDDMEKLTSGTAAAHDLKLLFGEHDGIFEEITDLLESAGGNASASAMASAWYDAAVSELQEKVNVKYDGSVGGWVLTVPFDTALYGWVRAADMEAMHDDDILDAHIACVVETEGKISADWARGVDPWKAMDDDYFNELLSELI